MFFHLCTRLGFSTYIKEVQQEPIDQVLLGEEWKEKEALGLLTDAVFYQSGRKEMLINKIISHCSDNGYLIVGLFRTNKLKRYISEKYAYYRNDFSMSNKDCVSAWTLDTHLIAETVELNEKHEAYVRSYVESVSSFDYILSFEDVYEKEEASSIRLNGVDVDVNIFRESYLHKQAEMYRAISNIDDIPCELLEKYPLFA